MSDTRRLITALGIGQICSWGSLYYSFPLIATAMTSDLGWSTSSLYGTATLGLLLSAVVAYPVGVAVDQGHGRWVMGLSSIFAAVMLLLWSQVASLTAFYFLMAGIGIAQGATLYEPAFAVIARRVGSSHARRGITTLTLWGGFASTVFIPLIQWLMDGWGWRTALLVLAAINLILCAGAHLGFIRPDYDKPPQQTATGPATASSTSPSSANIVSHTLRRPEFWALLIALTAYSGAFTAFTFHVYPLLREQGVPTHTLVTLLALIGPAQVAGRIGIALFGNRLSARKLGAAVMTLLPLAFVALILAGDQVAPLVFVCLLYGASNGIITIVRGVLVPEMLTPHAYGAINGVISIPVNLARAVAPAAAALLWAVNQSYTLVMIAILALALVMTASFWVAVSLTRHTGSQAGTDNAKEIKSTLA